MSAELIGIIVASIALGSVMLASLPTVLQAGFKELATSRPTSRVKVWHSHAPFHA